MVQFMFLSTAQVIPMVSNDGMVNEAWIAKDVEGKKWPNLRHNHCTHLQGVEENYENLTA